MTAATDTMFPHWQGASKGPDSTPAAGHMIDCSPTNTHWGDGPNQSGGCTLTIYTVATGSNCYYELLNDPLSGAGGENLFTNTQCVIRIDAGVTPQSDAGTSDCGYLVDGRVSWQSGVNTALFNGQGVAISAALTQVRSTKTYHLAVVATGETSGPLGTPVHVLTMKDNFVVTFNSSSCPGDNRQNGGALVANIKANVYDPVSDTDLGGSAGFVQDNTLSIN